MLIRQHMLSTISIACTSHDTYLTATRPCASHDVSLTAARPCASHDAILIATRPCTSWHNAKVSEWFASSRVALLAGFRFHFITGFIETGRDQNELWTFQVLHIKYAPQLSARLAVTELLLFGDGFTETSYQAYGVRCLPECFILFVCFWKCV